MKVFILCGGKATRFNNGKPGPLKTLKRLNKFTILENIIHNLKQNNLNDIYLLGGYKINELRKFIEKINLPGIKITLINSKVNTNTGGRLLFIKEYIKKGEKFLLTYGDSIVNYNYQNAIKKLQKKKFFIISCYKKEFSYGRIIAEKDSVKFFEEKTPIYINAGYYILDSRVFSYIKGSYSSFEKDVLPLILSKNKIKLRMNYVDKWFPIDNNSDLIKAKKNLANL